MLKFGLCLAVKKWNFVVDVVRDVGASDALVEGLGGVDILDVASAVDRQLGRLAVTLSAVDQKPLRRGRDEAVLGCLGVAEVKFGPLYGISDRMCEFGSVYFL